MRQKAAWEGRAQAMKVSASQRRHILDGDAMGGAHGLGRGISGKSEFPPALMDDEIIAGIEVIANNPRNYPGGLIPSGGGRLKLSGQIKGIKTTVIVEPGAKDPIITAWPEGAPRNP